MLACQRQRQVRALKLEAVNIVTLKWGERYPPLYANRLYHAVRRHLSRPFRFLCLTDDPSGLEPGIEAHPLPAIDLPEAFRRTTWLKLGLFQSGLADMAGDCLFLDLDLLIVDGMDCFFEYRPGKRCIIHNWVQLNQRLIKRRPDVGNSSVFRWWAGTTQFIVDKFLDEQEWALANFHPEQVYLTYALGEKYYWPEEWVRSFKRHAVPAFPLNLVLPPRLPAGTRILVFHGKPDPDEAIEGYRARRWHRRTLPAPWVAEHWQDAREAEAAS